MKFYNFKKKSITIEKHLALFLHKSEVKCKQKYYFHTKNILNGFMYMRTKPFTPLLTNFLSQNAVVLQLYCMS